jgi:hypothetical protein
VKNDKNVEGIDVGVVITDAMSAGKDVKTDVKTETITDTKATVVGNRLNPSGG